MGDVTAPRLRWIVGGAQRLAALTCLLGAYQFAVSSFERRWLLVMMISAAIVATAPSRWTVQEEEPQRVPWPRRGELWRHLVPGWLLMTLAGVCSALRLPPPLTSWTWLAGAAWLLAGAWVLSRQSSLYAAAETPYGRREWWLGALIVTVAAALRLWEIDSVPRYVHCDEGTVTLIALEFYNDPKESLFGARLAGSYTMPNLIWVLAGFGSWLGGFNLAAARTPDVILGILSIALLFDGLRRVCDLRVATIAALLLAVNHTHLAFSRIASSYIQTAFVVALVFAVLCRVWRRPTYLNCALLAIVTVLGAQTYRASMVMPALLLGALLLLAMFQWRRCRTLLVPFVVFVITSVAAAAPIAVTMWRYSGELNSRAAELSLFNEINMGRLKNAYQTDSTVVAVGLKMWDGVQTFHRFHDQNPQYGTLNPMADRCTAALMLAGVVLALFGLRRFVSTTAFAITIGYLLCAFGLQVGYGFNRATGALPLAMVFPAIAAVQCWATLWHGRSPLLRIARDVSLVATVALCAAGNAQMYLVDYWGSYKRGDTPSEAAWLARDYATRYNVHLVSWRLAGDGTGYEGMRLIIGGEPVRLRTKYDAAEYVREASVSGSDLFIVDGGDPASCDALAARFPEGRREMFRPHPPWDPIFCLIFVGPPAESRAADPRLDGADGSVLRQQATKGGRFG